MSGSEPPASGTPTRPRRSPYRLVTTERLCLLIIVLTAALAMSPNVADPDLWGHVQFGRDVLTDGTIPATNRYSYTAPGYRWINHENLSEIIMAGVAGVAGPLGLVFGKFLLSLFVILAVLRWNLKQGTGLVVAAIMTLLVATNLGYHWSIRPQLSSFVCFTLLLLLLQYSFSGWRERWHLPWPRGWFATRTRQPDYQSRRLRFLWLAPLLFAVWANSHGGFVAGICVYVAYLGMRAGEALARGGSLNRANAGWGLTRRMGLMAVVAVLATFLNPYGPNLHRWLMESLGSPRPEISDWSGQELFTVVGMKLWLMLGVAGLALFGSRRRPDATQLVILALLLWQSLAHFRHVPFLALAIGFWIGPHLKSALDRVQGSAAAWNPPPLAKYPLAWRSALILGILLVGSGLAQRLGDLQVRRNQFPVDAVDFMRQHRLHGRLVVTYDWAQYAIAALCSDQWCGPEKSAVAFDGRFRTCYPQSVVDMHFDFLYGHARHVPRQRSPASPPVDPSRVLRYRQPDLVLLRRFGERTAQHMRENSREWVRLYQDAIAEVWGQRAIYDNPRHARYLPPQHRRFDSRPVGDSVTWPAIRPCPVRPARRPLALARSSIQTSSPTGRSAQ